MQTLSASDKQESGIEAILVTQSRQIKPIDSGSSKQTFHNGSDVVDSSIEHGVFVSKVKGKASETLPNKDDSFQLVTNRR